MRKRLNINPKATIREVWLHPEDPSLDMDEAVARARQAGNQVLDVDYEQRRILVHRNGN